MERTAAAPEYQQSGLPSPYPSNYGDNQSEASSADHASAAQYAATNQSEVRTNNYPAAATPTSEYSTYPASARSSSFPEHIQRPYHPAAASTHSGSSAGMAQQNSPSQPHHHLPAPPELPASSSVSSEATLAPRVLGSSGSAGGGAANSSSSSGSTHLLQQQPSPPPAQQYRLQPRLVDTVPPPIDPSLPAPSPTFQYPPQHSPYGPPPHSAASHQSTPNSADMAHGGYSHHPAANPGGMYAQPRPDWSSYNQHPPLTPNHPIFPPTPTHAQPPARSQVRWRLFSADPRGVCFWEAAR